MCHDRVVWRVVGCFTRFTGAAEAQQEAVLVLAVDATGGERRACRSWSEGAGLPSIGRGGTNLNLIVGYNPLISPCLSPLACLCSRSLRLLPVLVDESLSRRLPFTGLSPFASKPSLERLGIWVDVVGFLPLTVPVNQRSDIRSTVRYSVDVEPTKYQHSKTGTERRPKSERQSGKIHVRVEVRYMLLSLRQAHARCTD